MNVKRVVVVSLITFLIGGIGGGAFAYVNHPANGGSGGASLTDDLKQARANQEVQQFINKQEKERPDGLAESKIETGSKYTGITYNGENNSVVIATPQKEQGNIVAEDPEPSVSNPIEQPNTAEKKEEPSNNHQTTSNGRVAIQEGTLNVRSQASTDGAIVGHVYKGDTVKILNKNGAWYQVQTADGVTGYVSATYIEVLN